MGDVISSHLDEAKREIITGEERFAEVCLVRAVLAFCHMCVFMLPGATAYRSYTISHFTRM